MMQTYIHWIALPAIAVVFVFCVVACVVTVIQGIGRPRPDQPDD